MPDSAAREADDAASRMSTRSQPRQERSRARQTALVDAAEAIVVEVGIDGLRMREVARRAGLPIASVYHYFPSTASIIREISVRYLERLGNLLAERLDAHMPPGQPVVGRGDLASAIVDDIAGFVFSTPSVAVIWSGLHSNPDLRTLDVADTIRNARHLRPYLRRLLPGLAEAEAEVMALVVLQAVSSNLMLALELRSDERQHLVTWLKAFIVAAIAGLARQ